MISQLLQLPKRLLSPFRGIPTRIILGIVVVAILVHLVLLAFYTHQHNTTQRQQTRSAMIQQVMNIIHMAQATPRNQLAAAIEALDQANIKVYLTDDPLWEVRVTELTFWRINRIIPEESKEITISLHLDDSRWLNIQAHIGSEAIWAQILLFLFEIMITTVILFYVWSISRFTNPLRQFQNAAERLGVDFKNTQLFEYKGPQVVRETALAMNTMQQRIIDLIEDRTLMLAAISHDLRTPITRLRLRANKIDDAELQRKTVSDLNEMETMISEILAFARHDHTDEKKTKLDINSLLEALCDDMADMDYAVTYEGPAKRIPFVGRSITLKRAVMNLINNAIKYGDCARVKLKTSHHQITITIDDDGPGIPDRELEHVFAPFYRCDRSRSRQIAGTGLGLAVARDAIFAHRGDIDLMNRPEGGLRVTVTL